MSDPFDPPPDDPAVNKIVEMLFNKVLGGSLREHLIRSLRPPDGFDTWEDYEKYGDAFVDVSAGGQHVDRNGTGPAHPDRQPDGTGPFGSD